jgi:small conductance mechanosensitive channel
MDKIIQYLELISDNLLSYAPTFLQAVAMLFIGFWLIKKTGKVLTFSLHKANLAPEVVSFLLSLFDIGLKILLLIILASFVGIEMTSLVAVMAAAGFAVGLALQGSLSNFAAGIMIMIFKPYKLGDWVEINEKFGKVEDIQIFNTSIVTPGQKVVIIPNGKAMEGVITNFSSKGHIRLELQVMMPYEENFPKVKKIILEALKNVNGILQDPEPMVGIESYDSHNIILAIRPFINPDDYWDVTFEAHQHIKAAFSQYGIKMAYSEGVELGPIGE